MPNWAIPILTSLVPALIIAVVTSVLTVRLSLRRFHAERWWERKAEAYSRIIEALYNVVEYCDAQIDERMQVTEMSDERTNQLLTSYRSAYVDLRKATGIGAYIISDEVAGILLGLELRPKLKWQDTDVVELFDAELRAHKDALTKIRRLAKKDLRVT